MSPESPAVVPPATEEPTLLWQLTSVVDRLDWNQVFPLPQPVELELGCGDAGFLIEWAKRHPHHNFLGVERLLGRLRKLDRKGRRAGLSNVRGLRIENAYLTENLVPSGSLFACHIYFPDPWPKRRHGRRRLIQAPFAASLHRALSDRGHVYLRTDHAPYFAQMLAVFRATPGFVEVETPADLAAVTTDFERDFAAKGIPAHRMAFRKVSLP